MKKRLICTLLVSIVLLSAFIMAQENNTANNNEDGVEKGYKCLENQIDEKDSFSLQEAVFASLALGSDSKLQTSIENEKNTREECWPRNGCKIKDSAQVLLAYEGTGKNTNSVKSWLLAREQNAKDLTWYLEIDIQNHETSECKLKYDGRSFSINVKEDMALGGNAGSCFDIAYGGFWLKINNNCLDKEFEVSCDKDFISTLVYQKSAGGTVFVSSDTESGVSGGATKAKVNSKCFSTGDRASCDYEGTLWAALALNKLEEGSNKYIPYLLALSDNNQKFLPSAFIYILTSGEDQYSLIIEKQKQAQFWDVVGSPYNRFYDTSVALLALAGSGSAEFDSAQNYLLNTQTNDGCWNNNNIRDTAFVLYSGWPRAGGGGGGGGGGSSSCEEAGKYCASSAECISSGGIVLNQFICRNFKDSCCDVPIIAQDCDAKKGIICSSSQDCDGRYESSSDGSCCIGSCIDKPVENLCAVAGGKCFSSCTNDEEQIDENCPIVGEVCCITKKEPPIGNGVSKWVWILIVLIIVVVLGIIFRKKLQIWIYKRRGGRSERPRPTAGRPPGMPPGMMRRPMPRYGPGARTPVSAGPSLRLSQGAKSPKDKEIEETMRKLKEISG